MSYLIRKVENIAEWSNKSDDEQDLPADTLTHELKTTSNTLSLWEISDLTQLDDIAIAIATTRDEIKDFFLVYFEKDEIEKNFDLINQKNESTPFEDYQDKHYDIQNLKVKDLCGFAKKILQVVEQGKVFDFLVEEEKDHIKDLVDSEKIKKDILLTKRKWKQLIFSC